jgi:hypothetical protein
MEAAPRPASESVIPTGSTAASAQIMDRDFIARNQIVERYLSGRLPIKGVADFERFCREHPDELDALGLPERVNKALRLLDASGHPEPWQHSRLEFWQKPAVTIALAAACFMLLASIAVVGTQSGGRSDRIEALEKRVVEQPLSPATSTRAIRVLPSKRRTSSPAVTIGGEKTQMADLKLDLARSPHKAFRITIDRVDQGRVAVLHNMQKDSNGHVRIALNSSALGPGNYQLKVEGLDWRGTAVPDSWITIAIAR